MSHQVNCCYRTLSPLVSRPARRPLVLLPGFPVLFQPELPGCAQRAFQDILACRRQANVGGSIPAPPAGNGNKNFRQLLNKGCLLLWSQHQVAITLRSGSQRRENSPANPKVRLPHVRTLFGALQAQSDSSKVVYRHLRNAPARVNFSRSPRALRVLSGTRLHVLGAPPWHQRRDHCVIAQFWPTLRS